MDIKKVIFLGCLAVSAGSAIANVVLTDFSQKQAIEVRRPVMNDTIAPDGSKFDIANLLKSSIVVDFSESFEALADTAGVMSLKRPDKNAAIHLSEICGVELEDFAVKMFGAGSNLGDKSEKVK